MGGNVTRRQLIEQWVAERNNHADEGVAVGEIVDVLLMTRPEQIAVLRAYAEELRQRKLDENQTIDAKVADAKARNTAEADSLVGII